MQTSRIDVFTLFAVFGGGGWLSADLILDTSSETQPRSCYPPSPCRGSACLGLPAKLAATDHLPPTSWCDAGCGAPRPSLHAEGAMMDWHLKEDDIVVLRLLDDIPEHLFKVLDVYEDCITGYAITGPLKGVYGEPELELILRVHSRST